ncbi:hypothetical protein E4U24_000202, partial [Claviceps purpurea]
RFLPERRGTEDPLESCGNDSEVAVVSPEDALPGGPEAVAASPVLLLLNPIITWSDSRESWDNSRDVEIDLTNPFEWPSDTMDGWIDQHTKKCDFEVKDGRLLVQVSFYVVEEQTVATPRSGRRDRRKRRPTVGSAPSSSSAPSPSSSKPT